MTIVTLQNNIKRLVIVTLQMKFSVTLKFSVISKLTEWSQFISKTNTAIQVYAPTSIAEETEVERFYKDLQDLLELTIKKMSFSS